MALDYKNFVETLREQTFPIPTEDELQNNPLLDRSSETSGEDIITSKPFEGFTNIDLKQVTTQTLISLLGEVIFNKNYPTNYKNILLQLALEKNEDLYNFLYTFANSDNPMELFSEKEQQFLHQKFLLHEEKKQSDKLIKDLSYIPRKNYRDAARKKVNMFYTTGDSQHVSGGKPRQIPNPFTDDLYEAKLKNIPHFDEQFIDIAKSRFANIERNKVVHAIYFKGEHNAVSTNFKEALSTIQEQIKSAFNMTPNVEDTIQALNTNVVYMDKYMHQINWLVKETLKEPIDVSRANKLNNPLPSIVDLIQQGIDGHRKDIRLDTREFNIRKFRKSRYTKKD